MNVIALRTLKNFWIRVPQAETPLRAWYGLVEQAEWKNPADVKAMFNSADFVSDNRIIFDIGGNNYRLIVHVSYQYKSVLIKFVGTHKEYDAVNATIIGK